MSLFVDNLIFEDDNNNNNSNHCEEPYNQNDTCTQIESNLLDLLDDEPLDNTSTYMKGNCDYKDDSRTNSPLAAST